MDGRMGGYLWLCPAMGSHPVQCFTDLVPQVSRDRFQAIGREVKSFFCVLLNLFVFLCWCLLKYGSLFTVSFIIYMLQLNWPLTTSEALCLHSWWNVLFTWKYTIVLLPSVPRKFSGFTPISLHTHIEPVRLNRMDPSYIKGRFLIALGKHSTAI